MSVVNTWSTLKKVPATTVAVAINATASPPPIHPHRVAADDKQIPRRCRCCFCRRARCRHFAVIFPALLPPLLPPRRCRCQAKPAPPPLLLPPPCPSTPFRLRRSTLVALPPLSTSEARASAVAVAAAVPVAAVSPSLIQPCCLYCRHHVAVSAKQSLHLHCRCRLRLARQRRFAFAVQPLSRRRRCRHANPTPPQLLLLPPFPSPPFRSHCSSLAAAIVSTVSQLPPSKARTSDVAVSAALPVAAVSPSPFHPHCGAAAADKQSLHYRRRFYRRLTHCIRFAVVFPASLTPLSPPHSRCHQAKPVPSPLPSLFLSSSFPSPPLRRRRSTLIAPPPPHKARTAAVAFSVTLPVADISPSLFQLCCRHCHHCVAIAAKQISCHRRLYRCRLACFRCFAVSVPV